ncbi:MAG TPA: hypothetical protein VHA52_00195 [Candidatus Babeliaceae bacterium]|nr:hypothetical protein [Candidatus Babeliaceae bacterium]
MKNKKRLLRLSYLLKTSASICLYLAIVYVCFSFVYILEAFLLRDINNIIDTVILQVVIPFMFYTLYVVLNSVCELIKALINIAEHIEQGNNKAASRYFTT